MKKLNHSFLTATILAAAFATACANTDETGSRDGNSGQLSTALTLGEGAKHDVASAHFVVVPSGGSCTDIPIAETTGLIEEEALQGNLDPAATPLGRAFIDGLMVLPPGDYKVCVTPLQDNGLPSAECEAVSSEVTVAPEVTTEVVLISQCEGNPNGALDVVVGLNDPPLITDLNIGPSKFITTCQTASLAVEASDPNGDELSYEWEVISGPAGGVLVESGATAQFTPSGAGDWELRVTVYDETGGSTSLSFPVHVSEAEGSCEEPATCPSGTYDAGGFCWVVAQDFEDGVQSCGRFDLEGSVQDVEGVEWTPELMAEVSAAIGCTNLGDNGDAEPSLWIDTQTNECFTHNFSDEAGQSYQNAQFPMEDWQDAVHLCQRPE